MTRLYRYVCALHVCVYSSTYCKTYRYTCDCYFLCFTCSSEHFAKVQFATISLTFVKATGQSNKPLRLCVLRLLSLSLCPPLSRPPSPPLSVCLSVCLSVSLSLSLLFSYTFFGVVVGGVPSCVVLHHTPKIIIFVKEHVRFVSQITTFA